MRLDRWTVEYTLVPVLTCPTNDGVEVKRFLEQLRKMGWEPGEESVCVRKAINGLDNGLKIVMADQPNSCFYY
jgi:hypothetical protein